MARKNSAGLFLTALSAILALVSFIAHMVNAGTAYFGNLGVSPAVAGCTVVAIVLEVVLIVVGKKGTPAWADVLPVVSSVLLIVATVMFISVRVNGIAAIITFENNAQNMADMTSAIVGIATCLIAAIISIIASFFDISKEA
jgi:hypothetical protein